MFESSFILPSFDTISEKDINLDEYQDIAYRSLMFKVLEDSVVERYEDKYMINGLVHYVTKYLTEKIIIPAPEHINSQSHIIRFIYHNDEMDDNTYLIRLSLSVDTFIDIASHFIINNLLLCGIFTELWEPPNLLIFEELGDKSEDIILIARSNIDTIQDPDVYDRLYENHRNSVIEETFKEDKNHEIIILDDESIDENEDNKECHLCYSNSKFICSKCNYPICELCMEHIKKTTGLCPCCRTYPIELIKINKVLSDKNELTEGTK